MNSQSSYIIIATMGAEALSALWDLRWMLVLIVVLIVADFWFGVSESIRSHKEFRFSRAGRRTCNKAIDYIAYLMVGAIIGLAIFEPLGWMNHITTAAIGLSFACILEVDSIAGHICALHGIKARFSIKRFIIFLVKKKNQDVGEALENGFDEGR